METQDSALPHFTRRVRKVKIQAPAFSQNARPFIQCDFPIFHVLQAVARKHEILAAIRFANRKSVLRFAVVDRTRPRKRPLRGSDIEPLSLTKALGMEETEARG